MSMPAKVKTYAYTVNQRIVFASVLDACQKYAYGLKTALLAGGLTHLWSASGGTGPTNAADHTDRITSAATWTPRATIAGASQAWFVLTDGNGAQWLFAFQGASDDVFRVSFSPGALFTLAGTTNQQPTATDEQVIATGITMVSATASADRVWHCQVSTDAKIWRAWLYRQATCIHMLRCERISPVTFPGSVTWTVPVVGYFHPSNAVSSTSFGSGTSVTGKTSIVVSSVRKDATVIPGVMAWGGTLLNWGNTQTALQGANGYPISPIACGSSLAGAEGPLGLHIDIYIGRTAGVTDGDSSTDLNWIYVGAATLPWDGVTALQNS
jgi:hypothetical protein